MPDTRRDVPGTAPTGSATPPPPKASGAKKPAKEASSSKRNSPAKKAPSAESQTFRSNQTNISADERRRMIAEAAYFRAQQRGFMEGDETRDWLDAERDVDAGLGSR